MNKATAVSPANLAFVKFWGLKDAGKILAFNPSISMNLSKCLTKTTVYFDSKFKTDEITLHYFQKKPKKLNSQEAEKIVKQLDRIRKLAGIKYKAQVYSQTNFPSQAGIAASASAFSALTLAASRAAGLKLGKKELSGLTRLSGSGSACRSVIDGFAIWQNKDASELASYTYWPELRDIVVVVDTGEKTTSSFAGHLSACTSPYFKARQQELKSRIPQIAEAIKNKDLKILGEQAELDTLSMHLVMMTSKPPIFSLKPSSWQVIEEVRKWRQQGLPAYFSIDNGPNIHILCEQKNQAEIAKKLKKIPQVLFLIVNKNCPGARLL